MDFSLPFGGLLPGARGAVLATLLRTGGELTGRRIWALTTGQRPSLTAVQHALRDLERLGLVTTQVVGSAHVHHVNENHVLVQQLRAIRSPLDMLRAVVEETVSDVDAVIVFGSVGRGEARPDSDVDLAVIADVSWDGRATLAKAVHERLGNDCDVLHLTRDVLTQPPAQREPVVSEILRDGVVLLGELPRAVRQAAS